MELYAHPKKSVNIRPTTSVRRRAIGRSNVSPYNDHPVARKGSTPRFHESPHVNEQSAPRSPKMSPTPIHTGQRVLVIGLGRFGGGGGVARWLAHQGCQVTVTDLADAASLTDSLAALDGLDIAFHLGGHDERDLHATDLAIVSPAVPKSRSAFFQAVVRRQIPWTTEINLFCERCPAPVIGVTGTYGKSTTCAMLAHTAEACRDAGGAGYTGVHLGGNIGRSLLMDLPRIHSTDLVILELSNAQLEDLPRIGWTPWLAVVTNLSPHHLDRYDGYAGYIEAKLNIIKQNTPDQRVFAGPCDEDAWAQLCRRCAQHTHPIVRPESAGPPLPLGIPGGHNQANAAMVLQVCRTLGFDEQRVRESLATFGGLPHRLQLVRTLRGVHYYDDSKSTSPPATATAIETIRDPIVVIVGGQAKDVSIIPIVDAIRQGCRMAVCVGESGPALAEALRQASGGMEPPVREAHDLASAVRLASEHARAGDAVLFSPGAPSFDAYGNFAERGRAFAAAVEALR